MTWMAGGQKVMAAFSPDGVTWNNVTALFKSDDKDMMKRPVHFELGASPTTQASR